MSMLEIVGDILIMVSAVGALSLVYLMPDKWAVYLANKLGI